MGVFPIVMRHLVCILTLAFLASASPLGAAEPALGVQAITKPSEDVTLSFIRPGRIAKVLVKDGQTVRAGDPLMQQDDTAELVQLRQLEAQAKNDTRVRAAEAQLAQKKVDANKLEEAFKKGAVSPMEFQHAVLDVLIADLTVELSEFEHEQDKLKYDEAKAQVDRMRLVSPISGRVEKVAVQEGEGRDAQQPVIRLVKIDPLHIDVPVPVRKAAGLSVGGAARVSFPQEPDVRAEGKIVHIASVADSASDTLLVRVEVPNPALRRAGDHVVVRFEAAPAAASAPVSMPAARVGETGSMQTSTQPKESRE